MNGIWKAAVAAVFVVALFATFQTASACNGVAVGVDSGYAAAPAFNIVAPQAVYAQSFVQPLAVQTVGCSTCSQAVVAAPVVSAYTAPVVQQRVIVRQQVAAPAVVVREQAIRNERVIVRRGGLLNNRARVEVKVR